MNVVIVEDEGVTALFLREVIKDLHHAVVGVFDTSDTLFSFLKSNPVDLIFMDININGALDGIQTANLAHSKYPNISFVYLTSYKDSQTIKSAQAVNPLGYLIKPVLESDLEAIMMVVDGYKNSSIKVEPTQIVFGEYNYNVKTKTLYKNNQTIALSKNEILCIDALVRNRNTYISSEQLIATLWEHEQNRLDSLRELIYRLRKKLPNLPLHSSSNIGYILSTSTDI
ncbi:MAG: DNA-binding response regulator [Sulfurimonas sp.]|jgi:DNA-binding response OmpR family regulator